MLNGMKSYIYSILHRSNIPTTEETIFLVPFIYIYFFINVRIVSFFILHVLILYYLHLKCLIKKLPQDRKK